MAQSKSFQFRNFSSNKPSPTSYNNTSPATYSNHNNNNYNKPIYPQPKINTHKGCHHEINFGKYKKPDDQSPETWYDLANKGQFGYIEWCLNTDKIDLHATTRPHAQTALLLRDDKKAKWSRNVSRATTEGVQLVTYSARINNEDIVSPEVKEQQCRNCQQFKNVDHYIMAELECDECVKGYTVCC
jgi:hypothetical protein